MSMFEEYLENTSVIKSKEIINESYTIESDGSEGEESIYENGHRADYDEIVQFLNLINSKHISLLDLKKFVSVLRDNGELGLITTEYFIKRKSGL